MRPPNPDLIDKAGIQVVSARSLFRQGKGHHYKAPSLARLSDGKILLSFSMAEDNEGLDSSVFLAKSLDNGQSWSEPLLIYSSAGWTCLNMGGLVPFSDQLVRLIVGRTKIDYSLGGDEPFSDFETGFIDSFDQGETWVEHFTEIDLFPAWTEVYGQSNPHLLKNGQFLMAMMGTMVRDVQWHSGVSFCDPDKGYSFSKPVITASDPERHYSDIDVVRLDDGRLLSVIREHILLQTVFSHSEDEGKTWSPIRFTGFKGSNIKLHKLNSGIIVCLYRDEDPDLRGVSVSQSNDGGVNWNPIGQIYSASNDSLHFPHLKCGYPDIVRINDRDLLGILHTYPDETGRIELQQFHLRDVT